MRRTRDGVWGVVLACGVMLSTAIAAEPAKTTRAKQRASVEATLAKPAEWAPMDARTVTLAEFIEHVREKHGLSIRWDAASIQTMSPFAESLLANGVRKANGYVTQWNPLPTSAHLQTYSPVVPAGASKYITNFGPQAPAAPVEPGALKPVPDEPESKNAPGAGKEEAAGEPEDHDDSSDDAPLHLKLSNRPIDRSAVALTGATVGEVLEQLLDAAVPPVAGGGEEFGIPMVTRALTLTSIVEGHSVVITTRLRANALKETRVYRIGHLKGMPAEQVAKTICHSVRPWSWRTQAGEIADRLAARFPKGTMTLPQVAFSNSFSPGPIVTTSGEVPAAIPGAVPGPVPQMSINASTTSSMSTPPAELKGEDLAALGQLLTGGAIAAVESIVNTIEIVHYGDPPTAVIEVLPGVLVITQSQAAHREIAELLEELAGATP